VFTFGSAAHQHFQEWNEEIENPHQWAFAFELWPGINTLRKSIVEVIDLGDVNWMYFDQMFQHCTNLKKASNAKTRVLLNADTGRESF
jgi:hypothetical protein